MQRYVAVAQAEQCIFLNSAEILVDDPHVGPIPRRGPQSFEIVESCVPVDRLDDEKRTFTSLERAPKGLDQSDWILPFDNREEVEYEQEQKRVGQSEVGPGQFLRNTRWNDRQRNGVHRRTAERLDRLLDKVGSNR